MVFRAEHLERVQARGDRLPLLLGGSVERLPDPDRVVLDRLADLADVGAVAREVIPLGQDRADHVAGRVGFEGILAVEGVIKQPRFVRVAGADRLIIQRVDDRPGVVALVEPEAGLVGLEVGGDLDLLRVVGGDFEEEAPRSAGHQVLAERLVERPAQPPAALVGLGDDEVEIRVAEPLVMIGEGEAEDVVTGAVRGEEDGRVDACRLRAHLAGDILGVVGEVGEGGGEEVLDLGDRPAVVVAVRPEDVANPKHAGRPRRGVCRR